MDESALLTSIVAGDDRAWAELVDRFGGLVWSVARSFQLGPPATDDVVQTVWLRLAEHAQDIRDPSRLAAWLATTTRHEALRVIRQRSRLSPMAETPEAPIRLDTLTEERVVDDELLAVVLKAFDALSSDDQQLLRLLCTIPPLDYGTIAEMLGRPIGSIGPTRARVLERLRRHLPNDFRTESGGR
jgi:RNA polymerase sigma factor (sigma-70 family)